MKRLIILLLTALFVLPSVSWSQGCMEATSEDGVQIIGYIQAQGDYKFLGKDDKGKLLDESSFYFNRARLGVTGNIPYDFSYYLITELSQTLNGADTKSGPFILDAFVSYNRFAPYVKVAVGQFKSPFGIELLTPCHKLHTINRALAVNQLVNPLRDQGIMLSGSTGEMKIFGMETKNFIGYNLAVMNGSGINKRDENGKKDIVGRLTLHPVEFLTLGASYRFGKQKPLLATATKDDERKRLGFDAEVNFKNFLVQGEFVQGEDIGSYTTGGGCSGEVEVHEGSVKRNGYFVQALYMTPWKIQPVVRFERFDPNLDINSDELTGASKDTDYIQNSIIYGFNYFFNDKVRFQFNYVYNAEENGLVEKKNDQVLAQMQIIF